MVTGTCYVVAHPYCARARPDHQRSVVMRRPDEEGLCAFQVREHHEAALGAIVKAHIKEAAN
jgi:hypothetical protein